MKLGSLKKIRTDKARSQEEVAVGAGLSLRAVAYIEAGRGTTLNTAKRLAKFLGVTVDQLKGAEA